VVASAAPDANLDASADPDLTPKVPPAASTKVETSAMGTPASLGMLLLGTKVADRGADQSHGHSALARTDDSQFYPPSRPRSLRRRPIIGPPEERPGRQCA
jgi:hypothetical protein